MGLDMYLYRQREADPPIAERLADEAFDFNDPAWYDKYTAVKQDIEVAYWRKANAIHAWFVENFQDGVDECQASKPIGREALAGLVERCRRILDGTADPTETLPTQSGFFFGDTEYDEWYRQGLKETIAQLEPVIAERNSDSFIYQSSW